jgi:hypothetical protein
VAVWQFKIRNLRRKEKGWSRNREAEIKRSKADLVQELDALDMLAEQQPLSEEEKMRRKELLLKLIKYGEWKILKLDKGQEIEKLNRVIEILYIFCKS